LGAGKIHQKVTLEILVGGSGDGKKKYLLALA
jgi:hypothetical protein